MHVTSINVGQRTRLAGATFKGTTGIFKRPVTGSLPVGTLGLARDVVCDTRHHGGPDQAVYLYRQEDYDYWSRELGATVAAGTFGDNLTVTGLPDAALMVGARLRFKVLELEVTAPRIPCRTLAQRMDDPGFVKRFLRAARPGLYLRVITPGPIAAGETCVLKPAPEPAVSTLEVFAAASGSPDRAALERFLAAPIDARTRKDFERRLARLTT